MRRALSRRWQENEPERLEDRARAWRQEALKGRRVDWLLRLADQAMDAATRLRVWRAARLRSEAMARRG